MDELELIRLRLRRFASPNALKSIGSRIRLYGGVDEPHPQDGTTILMDCLRQRRFDEALAALALGASVDACDSSSRNFFNSRSVWRLNIPSYALKLSQDPSRTDFYGETALFHAVQAFDDESFDAYLFAGVDPLVRSKACSLLEFVAARSHAELIERLLKRNGPDWTDQEFAKACGLVGSSYAYGRFETPEEAASRSLLLLRSEIARRESESILAEIPLPAASARRGAL